MQCATTKQRQDDFEQPIPMCFTHLDLAETYLFTHSLIVENLSIKMWKTGSISSLEKRKFGLGKPMRKKQLGQQADVPVGVL